MILGALAAFLCAAPAARAGGPEPGEKAPELEVRDWTNGGPIKLAQEEGNVLVLLFFQSNAPSMNEYVKGYVTMLEARGANGLKVVGISREQKEILAEWADQQKIPFPLASDGGSWKGAYEIEGYPFAYVVDVYGEVAWKGDGNRWEQALGPIDQCLKEVKRIDTPRADTGKAFERIWKALDRNQWPDAIKWLQALEKGQDEKDAALAKTITAEIVAVGDARLKRVEVLERRGDFLPGEKILKGVEKTFAGLPQAKTARDLRERWQKDPRIKAELDAMKLYERGRALEGEKQWKQAAELYRGAIAHTGTRGASRAHVRLADLVKRNLVR